MIDPNSYEYQENAPVTAPAGEQPLGPGGYPSQYRFSPEELRVLGDCNRESFVQRSVPFASVLGVGTYLAIQQGILGYTVFLNLLSEVDLVQWSVFNSLHVLYNGYLKPNSRFGVVPKVTLAVMAGYFLGKLSYQQACAEKLMALPGSYIGQLLRERRDGKVGGTSIKRQTPTMFGAKSSDIYSDAGPGSSLDLDTDRPMFSEDAHRPQQTDGPRTAATPAPEIPQRPAVSYDDLRRKNRGEHSDSKQDPYRTDTAPVVVRSRPAPAPSAPRTNIYGDVMD